MVMADLNPVGRTVVANVYISLKADEILAKVKAMKQQRSVFIGALIERYGDEYISELEKVGIRKVAAHSDSDAKQ
jgi:hypothetical protein